MKRTLAAIILTVLAATWLPPPLLVHRGPGLDASYWLGLNLAHAQQLTHGEEVVFPYGPLAWLCRPDPRSGDVEAAALVQVAWWGAFLVGLFLLARRGVAGAAAAGVVVVALLFDPLAMSLAHLEPATLVWALLAFATGARSTGPLCVVASLAAMATLVKVNTGVAAVFLLMALVARGLHTGAGRARWRPLLAPIVYGAVLLVGHRLAPGSVSTLPEYLANALEFGRGYGAMALEGSFPRVALVWAGLAVVPLLLVVVRDRRAVSGALVVAAVLALLAAKSALVRQGIGHLVPFLPRLAIALAFVTLAVTAGRDRRRVITAQLLVLAVGGALIWHDVPRHRPRIVAAVTGTEAVEQTLGLFDLDAEVRRIETGGESLLAELRLAPSVRERLRGATVDVVPWRVATVTANDLDWRPRPVFQDYTAYTPDLDAQNGRFWGTGRAPRFVLADDRTIDGRHVFFEAPQSWRALLDHYEWVETANDTLVLERREAPRFAAEERLTELGTKMGDSFAVPADDALVLLRATVTRSTWGRARGLLAGETPLFVEVTHASGATRRWRVVRRNLVGGVIVSALPASVADLEALFAPAMRVVDPVRSLRFTTDDPRTYRADIELRFSLLPITR